MKLNINQLINAHKETPETRQEQVDNSILEKQNMDPNTITLSEEEVEGINQKPPTSNDPIKTRTEHIDEGQKAVAGMLSPQAQEYSENIVKNDPNTWTPHYTQMGFFEKMGESLLQGVGEQVIGGTGDMLQVIGGALPGISVSEGNMFSKWFQEQGQAFADEHQVFVDPIARNPEWSLKTLGQKDFWSVHVAKMVPQLVEWIFISKGASGLAKGAARKYAKKYAKRNADEVLAKGTKVRKNVQEQVLEGTSKAVKETSEEMAKSGKGLTGKLLTTEGNLTKGAEFLTGVAGGGFAMNTMAGMVNAAELVNTHKEDKDENGNAIFSEDQLGEMAAMSMMHNLKYIGIDMLSWGLTYAGGLQKITNKFSKGLSKKIAGKTLYNADQGLKIQAKGFQARMNPVFDVIKRNANRLKVPLTEGFEESFQETWEEWAKKRALEEVSGKSDDYKNSIGGFLEFYASKENDATRILSAVLGGIGGGIGNVTQYVNKIAEDGYRLHRKTEQLKHDSVDAQRGALEHQKSAQRSAMIDNLLSNDDIDNIAYIDTLFEEDKISEEERDEMYEIADELEQGMAEAEVMNVKGKITYLQAKSDKQFYTNAIKTQQEAYNNRVKIINEQLVGKAKENALKKETDNWNELRGDLEVAQAQAQQKLDILLSGNEIIDRDGTLKFVRNEDNELKGLYLSDEDYKDYYTMTDEQIWSKIENQRKKSTNPLTKLANKLSDFIGNFRKADVQEEEKIEGEETAEETPAEETAESQEQQTAEETAEAPETAVESEESVASQETAQAQSQETQESEETKSEPKLIQKVGSIDTEFTKATTPEVEASSIFEARINDDSKGVLSLTENAKENIKFDNQRLLMKQFNPKVFEQKGDIKSAKDVRIDKEPVIEIVKDTYKVIEKGVVTFLDTPERKGKKSVQKEQLSKAEQVIRDNTLITAAAEKALNKLIDNNIKGNDEVIKRNILLNSLDYLSNFYDFSQGLPQMDADYILNMYYANVMTKAQLGPNVIDKARTLNEHYRTLFPERGYQAIPVINLHRVLGEDAVGYAMASAILIDQNYWNQDDIFMHEFAHIYYAANPNSTEIQELRNYAMRNKALMNKIQNQYPDEPENWMEEAVVATIQGPLSEKYNKYFDLKNDNIRQRKVRKFWFQTKQRAEKSKRSAIELANKLNEDKDNAYVSVEESILGNFVETLKNTDVTPSGRKAVLQNIEKDKRSVEQVIYDEWRTQWEKLETELNKDGFDKALINIQSEVQKAHYANVTQNQVTYFENEMERMKKASERRSNPVPLDKKKYAELQKSYNLWKGKLEENQNDEQNDFLDYTAEMQFIHDKKFSLQAEAFMKNISLYVDYLNQNIQQEYIDFKEYQDKLTNPDIDNATLEKVKNPFIKTGNSKQRHYLGDIKTRLLRLANATQYPIEFINVLSKTSDPELNGFYKYMKQIYKDSYLPILVSAHTIMNNSARINTYYNHYNENGEYTREIGLSTQESEFVNYLSQLGHLTEGQQDDIIDLIEKVKSNPNMKQRLKDSDIRIIMNAFTGGLIHSWPIIETNELIVNNNIFNLNDGIVHAIKTGMLDTIIDEFGIVNLDKINNKKFIQTLAENSRRHSALSVIQNPEGNNDSARQTKFYLLRELDNMSRDLLDSKNNETDKAKFINKYIGRKKDFNRAKKEALALGDLTKTASENLQQRNLLLENIWDNFHLRGIRPYLAMDLGSDNEVTNEKRSHKRIYAHEEFLNELSSFIDTYDSGNYMSGLSVLGDSSRNIKVSIPMLQGTFVNKNGKLNTQGTQILKEVWLKYLAGRIPNDHPEFNEKIAKMPAVKFIDFKKNFEKDVNDITQLLLDKKSDLSKFNHLNSLYSNRTDKKLNPEGRVKLVEFLLNRVSNGIDIHQSLRPGLFINQLSKYNKAMIAPVFAIHPKLKPQLIFISKQFKGDTKIIQNDSGQYVTERAARMIRAKFSGSMDLNNGFKLLNFSTERNHPHFSKLANLMKGHTTVLSDENTSAGGENEALRGLWELMNDEEEKYIQSWKKKRKAKNLPEEEYDAVNEIMKNPNEVDEIYLGIATPIDSMKSNLLSKQNTDWINDYANANLFNDPTRRKIYQEEALDKMYYDKDGNYRGLDGSNFGPQQVMDKVHKSAKLSVQMISSPNVNQSGEELKRSMKAQSLITGQMKKIFKKRILNKINGKSHQEIIKLIANTANLRDSDRYSMITMLDMFDNVLPYSPDHKEWSIDQMTQLFIRYGNNLALPGTIAQTISDMGYLMTDEFQVDGKLKTEPITNKNGDRKLKGYQTYADGTTKPMEVLLTKHKKEDGVRERKVYRISQNGENIFRDMITEIMADENILNQFGISYDKKSGKYRETNNEAGPSYNKSDKSLKKLLTDKIKQYEVKQNGETYGYYIPGELILVNRIPHNGPAFMGMAEVVGFTKTNAGTIVVPSEYKNVIGADDDGDAIFVYTKKKLKDSQELDPEYEQWNNAFDLLIEQWSDPNMLDLLNNALDFEEETDLIIKNIESKLSLSENFDTPFGFNYFVKSYNNSKVSSASIGIAFNSTKTMNMIAPFHPILKKDGEVIQINIDGRENNINGYLADKPENRGSDSRVAQITAIGNIIMDSVRNNHADGLKLTPISTDMAVTLVQLGFNREEVGMLFNHPSAQKYFKILEDSNNGYLEHKTRKQALREFYKDDQDTKNKIFSSDATFDLVINNPENSKYNSKDNEIAIIQFLNYLSEAGNEFTKITSITKGHKELEKNPFILEKQIQELEALLNNEVPNGILSFREDLPEGLTIKDNAELKNYLDTAKEYLKLQKTMNIVYNESNEEILDFIKDSITSTETLTPRQIREYSEIIKKVIYSRAIGINNLDPAELQNKFETIGEETPVYNIMRDIHLDLAKYLNELDNFSFLHTRVLTVGPNDIWLNPDFYDTISPESLNLAREEFSELPLDLQKNLILYDLFKRNWEGNRSLLKVFPRETRNIINNNLEMFQKGKNNLPPTILNEIKEYIKLREFSKDNSNNLPTLWMKRYRRPMTESQIKEDIRKNIINNMKNFSFVDNFIENKKDLYFQIKWKEPDGTYSAPEIYQYKKSDSPESLSINQPHIKKETRGQYIEKVKFDRIPENSTKLMSLSENTNDKIPNFTSSVSVPTLINKSKKKSRRLAKPWYHAKDKLELTPNEYDDFKMYRKNLDDNVKEKNYEKYLKEKAQANKEAENLEKLNLSDLTDEELYKKYVKFGSMDSYASAIVMDKILPEKMKRDISEQLQITQKAREELNIKGEGTQDITPLQAYWNSNNITATHPATQAIARKIETQWKSFVNERKKYLRTHNSLTKALYKEKLGLYRTGNKWIDRIHAATVGLFKNRKSIYNRLYGNISEEQFDTKRGKKRIRLLSQLELEDKLSKGEISNTEYAFAENFRKVIKELHPPLKDSGKGVNFVPAVSMSRFEALSARGLLGLLVDSKDVESRAHDVKMNFQGEFVKWQYIEDVFRNKEPNNFRNIKEYIQLKIKAENLAKKGVNEDGTPIDYGSVHTETILGTGMVNKFTQGGKGEGWIDIDQLQSNDLGKALSDFIHTSLFVDGNKNFDGFMKLQMEVDALLYHNNNKGFFNQNKVVQKVYKEYFLKGKTPQSTTMDKVLTNMVRLNLFYVMGWKLLVVGKGLFTVGNTLIGKYHNIKNASFKEWAKGESRYWGTDVRGKFNPRKSTRVLDNLNFMDINLYDEVNISKSGGFDSVLGDIALSPMRVTENWIQGAHFLGLLTNEEWNKFDEQGNYKEGVEPISNQRIAEIEDTVKISHGKGYTPTDQRLIQQYSWGRAMLQFSRFIPTMWYDRMSPHDVTIYGKKHVGSLYAVKHHVMQLVAADKGPKEIKEYLLGLPADERERVYSGLKGLAMVSVAMFLGSAFDMKHASELAGDANYLINTEKMEFKMVPSVARTTLDLLRSFFQ